MVNVEVLIGGIAGAIARVDGVRLIRDAWACWAHSPKRVLPE